MELNSPQDLVLGVLSATDSALTAEDISDEVGLAVSLKDVRVALLALSQQGEVARVGPEEWRAVGVPAPTLAPAARSRGFTEAELRAARERHGEEKDCPNCGKHGNIDRLFGWRRMRKEDRAIVPQSWCFECRGVNAALL
jgi:hypothetical protein